MREGMWVAVILEKLSRRACLKGQEKGSTDHDVNPDPRIKAAAAQSAQSDLMNAPPRYGSDARGSRDL
ncbi:hypothetical protein AVEN_274080-1 [Araneus ventricosus]|uniref:Uncharacterized protein n=1 Tax=Araneus ventricosus TaxID=182803 RepID=A0A4Y2KG46_ARAVE|nr:hypothetical protein AVEN_274080-1 [Araneus ventricosus]